MLTDAKLKYSINIHPLQFKSNSEIKNVVENVTFSYKLGAGSELLNLSRDVTSFSAYVISSTRSGYYKLL